jgi:hypothetical protein
MTPVREIAKETAIVVVLACSSVVTLEESAG